MRISDWSSDVCSSDLGYGPNGVAMLIECLTDNRNRAATEVRTALTRNGGSLADAGPVSYMFSRKGVVIVPKAGTTEDDVMRAEVGRAAGRERVVRYGEVRGGRGLLKQKKKKTH